jgi:hypothetical protein
LWICVYYDLFIKLIILMWFLHVEWQNSTDTCMNFYSWVWVQVWISTRSLFANRQVIALPDPNPARCHSKLWHRFTVNRVQDISNFHCSTPRSPVVLVANFVERDNGSEFLLKINWNKHQISRLLDYYNLDT